MNIDLNEEQQMLQDTLAKLLREHSTPARIRAAEATGMDADLWRRLVGLGVPAMRTDEAAGGGDMSLMHAVVAAEQAGRYLAPAPLVETIVANRLLARLGAPLDDHPVAIALHDVSTHPRQIVPGSAVARRLIALDGASVVQIDDAPAGAEDNTGSLPVRRIDFATHGNRKVLAGNQAAAFHSAIEEWKLLCAAQIAGAARRALELAAEYSRERVAFGRRIGEYQGVAHPLADSVTDMDGARLFVWRAVEAIAAQRPEAGAMISLAWWWAGHAGARATLRAMRTFGGIGMTMEADAQLYYRRVTAWSLLAGDPDGALDQAADRLWSDAPASLPEAGECALDFSYGPSAEEMAARAAAFCARHNTPEMQRFQHESGDGFLPDLFREMAREGLLYPDLPAEYDGGGQDARAMSAVAEAMGEAGWYVGMPATGQIVGNTIYQFGTKALRDELLGPYMRGEIWFSLGYTEPSGGSDIFAARTAATRDGDDWIINGQKIFTSEGHLADYCLMIARTGPNKYKGVTLFVVPVRQPGYKFTEIKTIGGQRTNITFYDGIRVPDKYRLGEVNGGVKVMSAALIVEQSGGYFYTIGLKEVLSHGLAWAREPDEDGRRPIDEPKVRRLLAEITARLQVHDALSRRSVWAGTSGRYEKAFGPMAKLFGSESWLWAGTELMKAAAPRSLMRGFNALGVIEKKTRRAIPATIYAGTSEIQRSIIAETALGMPRSR